MKTPICAVVFLVIFSGLGTVHAQEAGQPVAERNWRVNGYIPGVELSVRIAVTGLATPIKHRLPDGSSARTTASPWLNAKSKSLSGVKATSLIPTPP